MLIDSVRIVLIKARRELRFPNEASQEEASISRSKKKSRYLDDDEEGEDVSSASESEKKRKFKRPSQRLFDVEAIRDIGGEVSRDRDFFVFEGQRCSRNGFLYKAFNMNVILAEGIKQTLEELLKFDEQPENLEINDNPCRQLDRDPRLRSDERNSRSAPKTYCCAQTRPRVSILMVSIRTEISCSWTPRLSV